MLHKIDATGESFGRLATKVALILRGKTRPTFKPNEMPQDKVEVTNAKKIKFTGKKFTQKIYYRYSGYPGGIYARKLSDMFEKDPGQVFKKTVYAMLPKNKMRDKIIKHLTVK